jgi:hypothetical protein
VNFEWDEDKALANIKKHNGVTFEEATRVFNDSRALEEFDASHSDEEPRFNIIGLSARKLLFVVYIEREDGIIRIISARKVSKIEREAYEKEE